MTANNILDNGFTLLVDGALPYAECSTLTLDSLWTQSGTFNKDRYGNEVVSMPVKSYEKTSCRMMGKAGMHARGMGLPFTHGQCGAFSTGKELRVTELSVRPLE